MDRGSDDSGSLSTGGLHSPSGGEEDLMPNFTKGKKKAAAAKRGHKKTTKRKSHAGVKKAARARWRKQKGKK